MSRPKKDLQQIVIPRVKNEGPSFKVCSVSLWRAVSSLSPGALTIFLYFADGAKEGEGGTFNPAQLCEECGLSHTTYFDGLKELERKGYLKRQKDAWSFTIDPVLTPLKMEKKTQPEESKFPWDF